MPNLLTSGRQMKMQEKLVRIKMVLGLILGLNLLFWCGSRDVYERWSGVPPVPTQRSGAIMMTLGDPEFSYRSLALTLQSLGDVGVETTPLKDYNYEELGKWFFLLNGLDPVSDHVPFIAAYYFGASKVPKDVAVIVNYLGIVGDNPAGEKYRWLAHAVYMAQHRMYDINLALKLAYKLAKIPGVPIWAQQMPAFVLEKKGDKEAAQEMMMNLLVTQKNLRPEDINAMRGFLIERMGMDAQEVDRMMKMHGLGP